jgi:hypothetical protein
VGYRIFDGKLFMFVLLLIYRGFDVMSKSNPFSRGNTVNPKIFVKVTPDSTLIKNNDKIILNKIVKKNNYKKR